MFQVHETGDLPEVRINLDLFRLFENKLLCETKELFSTLLMEINKFLRCYC